MKNWDQFGVLTSFFDFSQYFGFAQSVINGKVITAFMTGELAQVSFIQTADLFMLVMTYVASAYVILCTIEAGVSVSIGFYKNYANVSSIGDLIYLFEVILILGWQLWAFVQPILATMLASEVWNQVEIRVAEAQLSSRGLETPVSWNIAIKTATLLLLVGSMTVVAGFSLGDIADEAITWVAKYEDDVNNEATNKETGDQIGEKGRSANEDITLHMVTSVFGMLVFGVISIGSFVFANQFLDVANAGENFECDVTDVDASVYDPL